MRTGPLGTGPSFRPRRRQHILWDGCCLVASFVSTIYHLIVKGEIFGCLYDALVSPICSLICLGCGLLVEKYKKQSLAVLFFILEASSLILDICGGNILAVLLSAYLLSVFVFSLTIQAHATGRNPATHNRREAEVQLRTVEIVFSFVQMMITFVHFILALANFKINLGLSIFPLIYATIALVLAFKFGTETTDSATANGQVQPNQPADLENASGITLASATTFSTTSSATFPSTTDPVSGDQTEDSLL